MFRSKKKDEPQFVVGDLKLDLAPVNFTPVTIPMPKINLAASTLQDTHAIKQLILNESEKPTFTSFPFIAQLSEKSLKQPSLAEDQPLYNDNPKGQGFTMKRTSG